MRIAFGGHGDYSRSAWVILVVGIIVVVIGGVHVRAEKIEQKRKEQLDIGHFHP